MDKIIEKAAELGEMIKETPEMKRLAAATEKYESDADFLQLIETYNAFAAGMRGKNKDSEEWASRVSGTKTDLGEAKAFYHSECARLIGNTGFSEAMVMLIDSYGNPVMSDYYAQPVPEPNAE